MKEELIEKLKESIIRYDEEAAKKTAEAIVKAGINPLRAIEEGISTAASVVGDKFEKGEYFLPDVLLSADVMKVTSDILMKNASEEEKEKLERRKLGKVVIATVAGDIHDIGKNILAALLSARGFEVHDLGRDAESMKIIDRALEVNADIIALSALMTTTRPSQKEVIDLLEALNKRDKFIVMVGGGPTDQAWAERIGADGWAEKASEAVILAQELVRRR